MKDTDTVSKAKANRFAPSWNIVWSVFIGVGALIAASAIYYQVLHSIDEKIDNAVEKKLSDETILRKIAAQSRPALIFDTDERIISDMGAVQLVKSLQITKRAQEDGWPLQFHIEFTRHFDNAPMLTSMYDVMTIIPKRGKGLSWDFEVKEYLGHKTETNEWVYRLELAP